ncbi:class I adenylate-forming enzyme family protein [Actinokineospora globicatena]|uniref:class I adenylate-forming enzyme family protein n=1 Tax=Actinokineospora globicatena TaxID=103729 RepID=UPI0020A4CEAB|nr:AMP-binding protein [Actinokineospora globicatena]MCP2303172.1 Acyl-coenzyme A synthetase/AMP-(fatty) acid ligase [Actinokineospora globicatena]GLW79711.1 putative fatty-acid-CoA ligase FadD [Actinokineospora globicatena]GLW85879.1 putative fatty-acid-CoA ligase FadD [Actinokineospora globicatena]
MLLIRKNKTPLYIGLISERAAVKHGGTPTTLDHDLDVLPEVGRRFTTAEFADHVDDIAARLHAAGVRPAERVVIHKSANFDICLLACAVARVGAVPVMLSPHLDGETVATLLARLDRPTLLTDAAKLDGELAGLAFAELTERVVSVTAPRPGAITLADLAGSPRRAPVVLGPDEPALMTHTSGTTGVPKLVVHSARSLGSRYRWQTMVVRFIRGPQTVAMHVSYVHSRMYLGLAVLQMRGLPAVFIDDPAPEKVADVLLKHRPGVLETHPNQFLEWEALADDPRAPLATVKFFNSTFDAIHPSTMHKLLHASRRRSPVFLQVYGQSECGPLTARTYRKRNALKADGRCQGYPTPGMTTYRLVSRDGKRPSRTSPGYIDVQTSGRALTYYGEQERFDKQALGPWWRGGDVGYRTKWGCLHLLDREVDTIPGIDSTLEVEDAVLSRLDELTEFVLVPGPAKEPVPVVCTRQDRPLDLDRWRTAVADLPPMTDPVSWRLGDLPRTATAKIRRVELIRRLHEQMAGSA